ncbi:MAG: copper homeostasis protein CutC [Flavobacterium sp.]|nr:MAG: copper homeostasis protein CutC [Flavobacterium sp.]
MIVEICASNFESALAAEQGGADRIELCTRLSVGGLSPPRDLIDKVFSEINIPVHVLVRPRSGNFCFSELEIRSMTDTIAHCGSMGCAGIVSGVLTAEKRVDIEKTRRLIVAAEGMEFTFHRAFDECVEPMTSLDDLLQLGVDRLLSSGQQLTAVDGLELLKTLMESSRDQIEIMPGAGINLSNVLTFKEAGFGSVHLSAIKKTGPARSLFDNGVEGISDLHTITEIVKLVR